MIKEYKLDNPVWNSLNEIHKNISIEYEATKFYNPEYCPFGEIIDINKPTKDIDQYSILTNDFYIVGKKPLLSSSMILKNELVCNQMLLEKEVNIEPQEQVIQLDSKNQKLELFNLVNLVQPGYFKNRTVDLGKYFGIYKDNKLIAVTGERMKMNEFTEISAVVTHPEHTGNGYAKQLIKYATDQVFKENKTPYLHVAESNIGAIKLYEKLGFTTRRKISFWNLKSK